MKTLIVAAVLIIAMAFLITSCTDRTRGNCVTQPDAPRCDTSNGATTP